MEEGVSSPGGAEEENPTVREERKCRMPEESTTETLSSETTPEEGQSQRDPTSTKASHVPGGYHACMLNPSGYYW
ncbi:hypothetical protein NDU88_006804 [Pleurodeles waltl]|uniref:Uncharacterized protein n=1 Tax=Pleurodeles waltl TaxID=8319 RepID=A0AAV7RNA2_PLEWA|nr:hypothetical protein NDU88_006804 [Pleurodeles waltl]